MIKAILLAATVPFMTQHRNILPKTEISTNFYGSVTGIVDQAYIEAHGGGGGRGGITTNNVEDIAYEISTNVVTNVVTKTFVEGLGISAGSTTNDIKALINSETGGTNDLVHSGTLSGYVPTSRTVNNKPLTSDISLDATDVGADGTIIVTKKRHNNSNQIIGETTNRYSTADTKVLTTEQLGAHNAVTGGVINGIYPLFNHVNPALSVGYSKYNGNQSYDPIDADTTQPVIFSAGAMIHTRAQNAITMGYGVNNTNSYSFVWSGDADRYYTPTKRLDTSYGSIMNGGFHVNPKVRNGMTNPLQNFWIGSKCLYDWISELAPEPDYPVTSVNTKTGDVVLTASDVGAATETYVDNANSNIVAIVQTWEGFLDGSNVVFSITNYVSGSYNLNTAKLRIMEMTNGVYREVYNSRDEIVMHIDNFRTNDFRVATNSVITSVDTKIAGKADKAWGKYTSTGTEIAGIGYSNTVYMTEPTTVFAGGMEYARFAVGEGSICVLTTKGAPVYTTGDEGTFKFQDNGGTNYFGFAKTDSYTIGANASGISVQNQIVTITYDVSMSGVPCIWYIGSLENYDPTAWEQLNTPDGQPIAGASHIVQWEQNPPEGKRICYINCPEPKGFFKATIEVAGDAKFVTNMPADLAGGILATNQTLNVMQKVEPYISNGQVLWRVKQ